MKSTTPKHVFLHLLMIIMLTISVVASLTIIFQYINHLFVDKAIFVSQTQIWNGIRWGSSILFVSLPVLLFCNYVIHKEIKKNKEVIEMKTRRWLLYLTQFVTAITIIIDLMVLLYSFYGGELTTRFFLKVIAVLIVAAVVLGYYRWEIKWDGKKSKIPKYLGIIVAIVALLTIAVGFFIVGTPNYQRQVRFDEQRIQHLSQLQYDVLNYLHSNDTIPTREELEHWLGSIPKDPETDMPYNYEKTADNTFRLCANFATDLTLSEKDYKYAYPEFRGVTNKGEIVGNNTWDHPVGEYCFEREVQLIDNK